MTYSGKPTFPSVSAEVTNARAVSIASIARDAFDAENRARGTANIPDDSLPTCKRDRVEIFSDASPEGNPELRSLVQERVGPDAVVHTRPLADLKKSGSARHAVYVVESIDTGDELCHLGMLALRHGDALNRALFTGVEQTEPRIISGYDHVRDVETQPTGRAVAPITFPVAPSVAEPAAR